MPLIGLLWMDLGLLGAILIILARHVRLHPVRWGLAYLLFVESYLAHWLIFSHFGLLIMPLQVTLAATVLVMPWAFWIFALTIFVDDFRPGRLHLGVLAAKVAVAALIHPQNSYNLLSADLSTDDLLRLFPNVIFSFALIFHVMLIAWKGRQDDLVEMRIDLRRIFILLMGVLIVWFMLSVLVLLPLGFGEPVQIIDAALLGALALAFLTTGLQLKPAILPELQDLKGAALPTAADMELEASVLRSFEQDHVHRVEGYTIRQLADHIGAQEYRVRRVINQQMGFRNFNDLLNRYRIQEACELLGTGTMPVIRIATEIGYPSPAPFNRAFRQITGMTPTEYRRKRD